MIKYYNTFKWILLERQQMIKALDNPNSKVWECILNDPSTTATHTYGLALLLYSVGSYGSSGSFGSSGDFKFVRTLLDLFATIDPNDNGSQVTMDINKHVKEDGVYDFDTSTEEEAVDDPTPAGRNTRRGSSNK